MALMKSLLLLSIKEELTDGPFGVKGYNSDFICSVPADSELIGT